MTVQNLAKFREDGKVVPSTMSSLEILELGWGPSVVKRVKWINDEVEYNYHSAYPLGKPY